MNFLSSLFSILLWLLVGFLISVIALIGIENENPIVFILLLIFLAVVLIIRRGKRIREKEEAVKRSKIFSDIEERNRENSTQESPEKLKNDSSKREANETEIGTYAGTILGLLETQLSLLTHVKNIKQNHFTIGYIFGMVDGLMQLKNIDINDEVSVSILHLVLESLYSKKKSGEILKIYQVETKKHNSLVLKGMQIGGEDVFNQFKNKMPLMGLCDYFFKNEDVAASGGQQTHDLDEITFDENNELEVRLEKLNKLFKNKLITKKVFEEKQAKLLSEL